MTPIEHFLLDIIKILFKDWKENTITDIGRRKVATQIFLSTLSNFFEKTLADNIFFTVEDAFLFRVALKI